MINKKFGKDLLLVIISNGVKLLSSFLTVFVIPLIFTQQDYGFYKLFLLYISYVGIFHFGLLDGIYLYYAGTDYESLDKNNFRVITKFLFIFQVTIALTVVILSLFMSGDRQLILLLVGISLFILNFTTYYQFISQVTQRFKEFAFRNIIYTVMNVALIGSFYIMKLNDYRLFLMLTVIINLLLLLWYVFTYKDITFGKSNAIIDMKHHLIYLFKIGIVLLFSNLVVMFFSSIPRQFVDIMYPIEIYPDIFSNFSFAYTLMGLTGIFMSAISLVLFPTLKKSTKDQMKKSYNHFNAIVLVLVFIVISAYFPLTFIIERFLSNYVSALKIFYILAPGIAVSSAVSVIIHNYFKTLNKNKEFLIIGILNLIILLATIFIVHKFISDNILYISIVTVSVQLLWYLSLDIYINLSYKNMSYKNLAYIILSSSIFYIIANFDNLVFGFFAYALSIILISLVFYFRNIKNIYDIVKIRIRINNQ